MREEKRGRKRASWPTVHAAISDRLTEGGPRASVPDLTGKTLPVLVKNEPSIKNKSAFLTSEVGRLAYLGLSTVVRTTAKRQNGETTTEARLEGQEELVSGLPVRAMIQDEDDQYVLVEITAMTLNEWLSAANYKIEKGQQAISQGERMMEEYRKNKTLWDANPDWTYGDIVRNTLH